MPTYLTTKELADLLRIKERKVYDLAASGEIPCAKAVGKLLFPADAIKAWLANNSTGVEAATAKRAPNVVLGSHDPLLDWALRESGCGLATYFDGSRDGLSRFKSKEGIATGLHLFNYEQSSWNISAVEAECATMSAVLVEWAKRQRGIIVGDRYKKSIRSLSDLRGKRIAPRQAEAGAQILFQYLLQQANLSRDDFQLTPECRTEADAALAILEKKADASFGLAALAAQYRLGFVPIIEERFDLLIDRRAWFEPPMQRFIAFARSKVFLDRARDYAGYNVANFGQVHFNGG